MYVESIVVTPDVCATMECPLTVKAIIRPDVPGETAYTVGLYTRDTTDPSVTAWTEVAVETGEIPADQVDMTENAAYEIMFDQIQFTSAGGYLVGAQSVTEQLPGNPAVYSMVETGSDEPVVESRMTSLMSSASGYLLIALAGAGAVYVLASDERTRSFTSGVRKTYEYVAPKVQAGVRTAAPIVASGAKRVGNWTLDRGIPALSRGVQTVKNRVLQPSVQEYPRPVTHLNDYNPAR